MTAAEPQGLPGLPRLVHEALLYSTPEEFVGVAAPFLQAAVEVPRLVAVVATLSKGYDLDYIWTKVDRGPAKDAASYYLQASESGGEPPQGQMGQHGKFGEMENPIGLTNEDDDFVPIGFA